MTMIRFTQITEYDATLAAARGLRGLLLTREATT